MKRNGEIRQDMYPQEKMNFLGLSCIISAYLPGASSGGEDSAWASVLFSVEI